MAKRKNVWDLPSTEIKKEAKKASKSLSTSDVPKEKAKILRVNESTHSMAKSVFYAKGYKTLREYVEALIETDIKESHSQIYEVFKKS